MSNIDLINNEKINHLLIFSFTVQNLIDYHPGYGLGSGYGLAGNGSLVELFVSKSTGSWTVMLTRPDGWTCLMATGGNWANLPAIEKAAEELM